MEHLTLWLNAHVSKFIKEKNRTSRANAVKLIIQQACKFECTSDMERSAFDLYLAEDVLKNLNFVNEKNLAFAEVHKAAMENVFRKY